MRSIITKAIALLIAFSTVTLAQQKGSFTDSRDKKTYKTVKIGEQVWMAENLNYADKDSKCYDDKPDNCTKYGRMYNWETALKACPAGWHLPRKAEWERLLLFADSRYVVNSKGEKIYKTADWKAKSGWDNNDNGTDTYGFSALPGGVFTNNRFVHIGSASYLWSSTENPDPKKATGIYFKGSDVAINDFNKDIHASVRCIQGDEAESIAKEKAETEAYVKANGGTFTDTRDNKTYKTIKINGQTWLAENLNYAAENTKCYDDKPENCTKYGRLYNWETAMKSCPAGWHLPKSEEWDKLHRSADGTSGTQSPYDSPTAGKFLKAANGWENDYNGNSGNGTDKFGFSALPGGALNPRNNMFGGVGKNGYWFTEISGRGFGISMTSEVGTTRYEMSIGSSLLLSVRCIKD